MSTTPQPPQPPIPPAPPRSSSNVLGIVLLILALVVVISGVAVWVGMRIITRGIHVQVNDRGGDKKQVSIKTPFGGIEVNKNEDISEASLGLPMYPGAHRMKDEDSASVSLGLPGENKLRIVAGKFESPDSFDKVKSFYQERLTAEDGTFTAESNPSFFEGDEWTHGRGHRDLGNYTGKSSEGKTVFEIRRSDFERVVALKPEGAGTRIELVRINFGPPEAN
ncbi:MAG TPA: hypothetical protein VGW33_12580 [Terriglobia bacterium]|nr:hypothetical protein [Terriglobia bacterium]